MSASKEYAARLTIQQAQQNQPWAVPYSAGVELAANGGVTSVGYEHNESIPAPVPHILGTHCVLHAVKSLGKIAAVYEARDHDHGGAKVFQPGLVSSFEGREVERKAEIRKMAADLMTAALRFANLEGFDLAEALVERVLEKNGADFGDTPTVPIALAKEVAQDSLAAHRDALNEYPNRAALEATRRAEALLAVLP